MTLACTISATGISAPTYADILASLQSSMRSIYGEDIYLGPDSQDGQWLGVIAQAIHDCNASTIGVYNSFSPATAQGAGLSSVVKINGIQRLVSTHSTATVTITGTIGTIIVNGIVGDGTNRWLLPATVTIPLPGTIDVTATAEEVGDIAALSGAITKIITPTLGWQTVNNAADATAGAPVETDAALRIRQSYSTAISAETIMDSIISNVANLTGVQELQAYENDTGTTDSNGIPAHSISLVVHGGDNIEIATVIAQKKAPGTGTYGTTTETIIDAYGVPIAIHFYRPTIVNIAINITVQALPGYVSPTGDAIIQALADYVSGLPIGNDVYLSKLYGAADGVANGNTFDVTAITMSKNGGPFSAANVAILFNELASCIVGDVALTVIP